MARFFVDRPIVAIVIAIVTVVLGLVAMTGLPDRAVPLDHPAPASRSRPPTPGADAVTIEQSVATPIEQQMNGVEKMLYMQSTNANDGTMTLTVTFDVESEVNIDQVNAQNRVSQAQPNLPADVNQFGLTYRSTVGPAPRGLRALLAEGHLRLALPRQLRAHQRQRRALPRARRGPGRQLRPLRVLDADLGEAGQAGQAGPHRARPRARGPAAERRQPRGPRGRGAGAARASSSPTPCARRAGSSPPRSSATSWCASTPTGSVVRLQGRGAHRAGRADLQPVRPLQRPPGGARRRLPGSRAPTRSTVADGVKALMRRAQGALPERPRLRGRPRHHACR